MSDRQLISILKRTEARLTFIMRAFFAISAAYLLGSFCISDSTSKAKAEESAALRLAQCIRAECNDCDVNPKEKTAIAWILKKGAERTGRTLIEQTEAYCAVFDRHNERSNLIWSSTFNEPKHGRFQWWQKAKLWAKSFLIKPPIDPLPKADHWGGNMDTHRANKMGWRRVAGPPEYANTFWSAYE